MKPGVSYGFLELEKGRFRLDRGGRVEMQLFSELPLNGETEQRRNQSSPVDGGRMSLEALEALAASEIYPGRGNGPRGARGGRGEV